jgi:ferric-dicitrate binding protein FerR (iron transport regulator)
MGKLTKQFAGFDRLVGRTTSGALPWIFVCLIAASASTAAEQLKQARVTQVIKDVKLFPTQAAPRPAAVNDEVRGGTAVRTGLESRTELTFTDLTITRLGANTIFSFNEGTRELNLSQGAILFQVPKGAGGAKIKTAAVTAAITGTTGIGEYHPPTASNPHAVIKWFCLEGTFRLYLPNGESVKLDPGQMIATDGTSLPKPLNFDIGRLINSSLFFVGYPPLPS